jgi:hypothetical protein
MAFNKSIIVIATTRFDLARAYLYLSIDHRSIHSLLCCV